MEYVCALTMTQTQVQIIQSNGRFSLVSCSSENIYITYVELILLSFLVLLNEFEEPIKKSCKILHAQFEAFWLAECTAFVMHS